MISMFNISLILFAVGVLCGVLGSFVMFNVDKANKRPALVPLRYVAGALLMGASINCFIFGYWFVENSEGA